MKPVSSSLLWVFPALASWGATVQAEPLVPGRYTGLCDASAVVALGANHFAVGDDEDNVIRVYRRDGGGRPVHSVELSVFLRTYGRSREVDIEGAARLGDRLFWISSHGRNVEGNLAPNRQRFFATTGSVSNGVVDLRPVGQPYAGLLRDLIREPRLESFNLWAAASLPPKATNSLNIEGLAATPEGHLLIGFRNPIPRGKALIVPLLNPSDLIQGRPARFGDPILLDLGGQGIRSITEWRGHYMIVAGDYREGGISRLYFWDGGSDKPRCLVDVELPGLNPEAISFHSDSDGDRLYIVSDDGTVQIGGKPCKKLKFSFQKQFRSVCLPF
jgi:hypothetical protein